ncbi:2-Sep [Zea mays]|uniref:2-Sep n=1 Tax=Zea mays TaxID=4577 RepID=A0A1D6JFF9_MAIZE|nr:2-Sep [Zea mays]
MAAAARAIICELAPQKVSSTAPKKRDAGTKVVLQPRLCTLRSYGAGSGVVTRRILTGEEDGSGAADSGGSSASPFFASLANYIESSRKSQDFETISGRLAMMFTLGCNAFVDSLIDNIVEALFSEGELQDWSDDM